MTKTITTAVLLLTFFSVPGVMAADAPSEYQAKAAFLYHFAEYVDWLPGAFSQEFVIGIVGEDPFGEFLDEVSRTKTLKNAKIVVRRFDSVKSLKPCHLLFVASSEKKRLSFILDKTASWNVLLVGDTAGFGEKGVAINFYLENSKIRFEVNQSAVGSHKLKMSSKLLRLAKIVG